MLNRRYKFAAVACSKLLRSCYDFRKPACTWIKISLGTSVPLQQACPFCNPDASRCAFSGMHEHAIWDAFPVNPGHMLIIPRRHVATWDELTVEEKTATIAAVDRAIALIRSQYAVDGFNVGFNMGSAAGQTVFHFHLHIIPRYTGDVSDPRGGVRHVIPARANYLDLIEPKARGSQQNLITGGEEDPLLPHLIKHMDGADTCDIAVAFLLDSGARLIVEHLRDFLARGGKARILVGDYLDVTDPLALRRLSDLSGDLTLRVYEARTTGFHLKSYVFLTGGQGIAFVGSSNLSEAALTTSIEWNYKIVSSHDETGFREIREGIDALFDSYATVPVTADWIDRYEARRNPYLLDLASPRACYRKSWNPA